MIQKMKSWSEVSELLDKNNVPRIGDVVYRICPAKTSRGTKIKSCKDCPWESCECPDVIKVWDSGSGCKSTELRVGKIGVGYRNIVEIWEYWFVYYFATEEDAKAALKEYSQYDNMKGQERSNAYKKYYYDARKMPNPLRHEVNYESI